MRVKHHFSVHLRTARDAHLLGDAGGLRARRRRWEMRMVTHLAALVRFKILARKKKRVRAVNGRGLGAKAFCFLPVAGKAGARGHDVRHAWWHGVLDQWIRAFAAQVYFSDARSSLAAVARYMDFIHPAH